MADPINCEGWDTGKPFLGVPSKFVVINEDGEEIGTLDELIPLLMLWSNNLSDIEDTVEARNNLGVYSKTEVNTEIEDAVDNATPDASTTTKGVAKIATTAIALAGTNDTDIITALKLKNTLGASKNALAGTVNFNGTGTVSIRSQLNVSSITDLGVGTYKINMTTAMPNANYPVFTSVADRSNGSGYVGIEVKAQTANSITVFVFATGTGGAIDVDFISVGWTP